MGGGIALDGTGYVFSLCAACGVWSVCLYLTVSEPFRAVGNVNIGFVTCVGVEEFKN